MEINPCLNCIKKDHCKNNPICRDCEKRIDYIKCLDLKLNFCASYSENQRPEHRISFFSRDISRFTHKGDAIF
jgi:hypothetical protein